MLADFIIRYKQAQWHRDARASHGVTRFLLHRNRNPYAKIFLKTKPCFTSTLTDFMPSCWGFVASLQLQATVCNNIMVCIEEHLKNITSHSKASHFTICITFDGESMKVSVADDGIAFNTELDKGEEIGFGLTLMRSLCPDLKYQRLLNHNITYMSWHTEDKQNDYGTAQSMTADMLNSIEASDNTGLMPMLLLKDVNKTYPGEPPLHVLKDINISIAQGEMVAVMGSSGSGKSTLLNIIGMLDDYDTGEYYLDGSLIQNISGNKSAVLRNELIGFIYQSFNLIDYKTALENVALPLYYRGVNRETRNRLAMEYLQKMGIAYCWNHTPKQMSGGQCQRVAIARALITHPRILLADEPTGALDSATTQEIISLLKQINRDENQTIIIVTHEKDVADQTQRIITIKDGVVNENAR